MKGRKTMSGVKTVWDKEDDDVPLFCPICKTRLVIRHKSDGLKDYAFCKHVVIDYQIHHNGCGFLVIKQPYKKAFEKMEKKFKKLNGYIIGNQVIEVIRLMFPALKEVRFRREYSTDYIFFRK